MDVNWVFVRSSLLSVFLHALLIGFLVLSIDASVKRVATPVPQVNIVKAVSVDKAQVQKELTRLKDIEKEKIAKEVKKQKDLESKLKELESKAAKVEDNRKSEEKKLAELQKKKLAETKQREEEQTKLAQLKKEKAEIEKTQKEAEEKKAKTEAERKKQEELKKKQEEDKKRKQEEQRLQQELAEEQKQQEAAQQSRDQKLLQNIYGSIYRQVVGNFNKSGLQEGLECVLSVRLIPGGEVISVTITKSSGDDIFDQRARVAVQKASPLPVPEDVATFERLKLRHMVFRFKP